MIQRQTNLSANIVAFCRYLRAHNFFIGPLEEKDALLAMDIIKAVENPDTLELCLQSTLCRNPQQLKAFPSLYQNYWLELDRAVDSKIKDEETEKDKSILNQQQNKTASFEALKSWLHGNKNEEETETATFSNIEVYGAKKFPAFEEKELKEVFQLVKKLVKKIANRRSRRFQTTYKKEQIDLKATLRKSIIRQAEIIKIVYRKKKKDQLKVILLCDVSRSMELYSRFLIKFMYAFQNLFPKIKTFVFSTSLQEVSEEFHKKSLDKSLEQIIEKVNNWSGGTKIGDSLATFNERFAHKHLSSKTLFIILSDGWDTGDDQLIGEQMKKIQRKSLKVLWLNPLAGLPSWKPEVKGMKASLPFIDALLPFHNIESLKDVIKSIKI
jgi:uncharacterized protein